ncbi:MAG: tetratricopeptide repeat protein [Gammaproteobacteria bacterium]|jgi:TPR repeat protein
MLRKNRLLLLLVLILAVPPAWADFNDGVVAYMMGDYGKAYNIMRSLAETANHGYAEYYLGMMYMKGQGVEQNYTKASEWFKKAAKQHIPQAQYRLGNLYAAGQGVPRDYERAYAWYKVAAVQQHQLSIESLSKARENLSKKELKEAEKLSLQLIDKYGPKKKKKEKPINIKTQ